MALSNAIIEEILFLQNKQGIYFHQLTVIYMDAPLELRRVGV